MLHKNWLQMKAEKKKTITEAVFTVLYGILIGYEVSVSFNNPDIGGLGYVIFVLISPVAFQQSCVFIFNEMVKDRETKMKESLKIMGLNKYMYALSFLVQRAMWTTVTCFIIAMMTYIVNSDLIDFQQAITLFFAIWLLAVDMLGLSLVIQNFFTDPKLAAICAPFLLFLPTGIAMLGIITPVTTLEPNNWIQYLFFLPTFPFEVILTSVFQPEQQSFFFVVSAGWAWASLVLLCPIYFFIHIYLEAIIPDAYGVTESCCFCIRGKKQVAVSEVDEHDFMADTYKDDNKNSTINVLEDEDDQLVDAELGQRLIHAGADQPIQNTNRRQSEARAAFNKTDPIQLRKMTMQFGDFKAVDELTMSIKQDEIIALLGHNGAGKTTAIYMLTGMLMPSGGDAVIHGNSIKRDTDEVRRSLGLCQQHDVLFDTVSVEEHLRLTMRIRSNQIDNTAEDRQISEILRQVMLTEHKDKLVKELSGGMKRKLSLGMALIGGTQTIILDEPTSGLDVESRQQVWELIRTLKQGRSIIMSTQHIEEADELADRVCIMSHGKVIALGTPQTIKRKFGVGYNLFIEPKSSENLSNAQITQLLATIERIFLNREGYEGITKSPDSTDKKSLFLIPISLIDRISNLMREVEETVPQMQVDIELNSLEDAFIKIAQNDIKEEVKQNKALAQAQILMSEEEEKAAFDDYENFHGEQSSMQKIGVIFLNRLKVFSRSNFQWYILSFPLLYVIIQLFIAYAVIITVVTDTADLNRVVAIFFTFYFTFFLVLGQSFTAGLYAFVPMAEKKGGLRQMMHMSGLKSLEYFVGLLMGDAVLFTIPAIVISIVLLFFNDIMVQSQVINFFFSYFLYGLALINMAYMFSHFFDDPETSGKYMALIFVLGLIFAPIAISLILAAIFGFDSSLSSTISIWYWVNPQMCFIIQLYQLCCYGNPDLDDLSIKLFGTIDTSTGLYVGVILIQIVIIFIVNILLDVRHNNLYRKRGGNDGAEPPMLEVRQDVRDHEQEVRQNAHLLQDDENSYQIKAIDICKTYPSGQRMAVCRNTFGARKGEVFGLLGPNGAGKSTTFNMIAMQLPITNGEAQLMGHELLDFPLQEQGKYFGQCNQENLIWENLTVDESMNFIASLKGINGQRRENVKRLIMETLELNFFKNTISKNLSGGNKRKLCCAQALMLCPKVLFLDEPTSGVDPVSRRSLNRMVKKMNMASVLLTTHRMDEAEQLCDKIAIMINGRFVVFGSPNYLKTQYGQGYTVEIIQERQMFDNPETDVRRYIAQQIPSAELIHDSTVSQVDNPDGPQPQPAVAVISIQQPPAEVRYRVEGINVAGSNVLLSDTFAKLATLISEQRIKDFTLMRTNMEQVFINFAKFQINAAAEGYAPVEPINNN